ncbi:hypothetical protein PM082_007147 [Marasmius tenuissimus]|nr:hypothetical protein PM082_007147 [Marasmius tenuissimus]
MTKSFSVILAISLLIIVLRSPVVRGLALESRQEISARNPISLGIAAGQLSKSAVVGIVVGIVAFVLLLIGVCCHRAVEKDKAAKRLQAQQGQ